MADNNLTSNEYEEYLKLKQMIHDGIENAQSEFMLTTYNMLRTVMNKRHKAAVQLNIQIENQAIKEKRDKKREQLRNAKNAPSGPAQRPTPNNPKA